MAVDPTDGTFYATYSTNGRAYPETELVTLDIGAFTVNVIGSLAEEFVRDLQFLADGTLIASTGANSSNPSRLWTVDKATGTMAVRSGLRPEFASASIASIPAELGGTLATNAVAGVATYSDLEIDIPAGGYEITAMYVFNGGADTLTASSSIDVNLGVYGPWPADLEFVTLPSSVDPLAAFGAEVAVVDVFGNIVDTSTAQIGLEYDNNAGTMLFRWTGHGTPTFTRTDYVTPWELGPATGSLPGSGDYQGLVYDPAFIDPQEDHP